MRRPFLLRAAQSSLVVAAAFAAGALSQHLGAREARAQQTNPGPSTIYVPTDGLIFRGIDGKAIARLSHDSRGGVFELYDEKEAVATRVPAAIHVNASVAKELHPNPYVADDVDPFEKPKPKDLGF
jgi:hypothetical protein